MRLSVCYQVESMVRFISLIALIAQLCMAALVAVHHHAPGDEHEDDCPVCQVLHAPARLGPPSPPVVLGELVGFADVATPVLWAPQLRPLPATCRGPPDAPSGVVA